MIACFALARTERRFHRRPDRRHRRDLLAHGGRLFHVLLAVGMAAVGASPLWQGSRACAAGQAGQNEADEATAVAPEKPDAKTMTTEFVAMTFNIRFNNPADGRNAWPRRRDDVAKLIAAERPDVIGMQEALSGQIDDLKERLDDYAWYGVGRDDGKAKGEFAPVFYRRDRFDVLDKGTFWLSETPEKPGSKGWDAALPRIATWLRLRDKQSGGAFLFANVHFDHRGERARLESGRLLRRKLAEIAGDVPVVLVGDFNSTPTSPPYKAIVEGGKDAPTAKNEQGKDAMHQVVFRDAHEVAAKREGPDTTWNGFNRPVDGNRIDHVFVDNGWTVESYRIADGKTADGRFYSDHFPIVAKLRGEKRQQK